MGFNVERVAQLRRFKDGYPLPMFQVQITQGPNMDEIYTLTRFQYLTVSVEKFEKTGRVNQCFKCQSFFHSSQNCHFKPRCVKCGLDHESRTCTKDRNTPPTCANCNGQHPASYRGCPKFPKWDKRQSNPTLKRLNPPRSPTNVRNEYVQPGTTRKTFVWGQQINSANVNTNLSPDPPSYDQHLSRQINNQSPRQPQNTPTSDSHVKDLFEIIRELKEEIKFLRQELAQEREKTKLSQTQTNDNGTAV